ncbi:MAG: hypothetical protein CMO55_19075 [Verrucomicrobiales bacterium]|nr:hypothetical protein [Verrucomicrobiales bacterium]
MQTDTTSKKLPNTNDSHAALPVIRWALITVLSSLVLAFLLTPLFRKAVQFSDLDTVHQTANQLKLAISAFHANYRKYPVNARVADAVIDSDHELMDVLLGTETSAKKGGLNPHRIAFYPSQGSRHGLKVKGNGGSELRDPWGSFYRVQIDADGDGEVDNPRTPDIDDPGLQESILVWSAGPDGDFDTWEDNQKTW